MTAAGWLKSSVPAASPRTVTSPGRPRARTRWPPPGYWSAAPGVGQHNRVVVHVVDAPRRLAATCGRCARQRRARQYPGIAAMMSSRTNAVLVTSRTCTAAVSVLVPWRQCASPEVGAPRLLWLGNPAQLGAQVGGELLDLRCRVGMMGVDASDGDRTRSGNCRRLAVRHAGFYGSPWHDYRTAAPPGPRLSWPSCRRSTSSGCLSRRGRCAVRGPGGHRGCEAGGGSGGRHKAAARARPTSILATRSCSR